ncbi:MAG: ABC transporter permease subunit [Hungatella sp.]|nr:ABC transporter permease subunit [Hungatella sp.]
MKDHMGKSWRKVLIVFFWIMIWQLAAAAIDNHIIIVGPWETAAAIGRLVPSGEFWRSIASSFGKISLGFAAAFGAGAALGSLGFRFPVFSEFLEPVMTLLKTIPVASFVILALIWAGSKNLSILIAFLVVLPMIYVNTLAGLKSTDVKLLEMAKVFAMTPWKKIRYIYVPALAPYLISSCRIALGMSWKSGVAAEVIGVPGHSIGEKLYLSKIYLNTADLLAWTFVIIAISALFEQLVLRLLSCLAPKGGFHES